VIGGVCRWMPCASTAHEAQLISRRCILYGSLLWVAFATVCLEHGMISHEEWSHTDRRILAICPRCCLIRLLSSSMQPSFSMSSTSTLNMRPRYNLQLHKQSIVSKQAAMPLYAFLSWVSSHSFQSMQSILLFIRDVMHHPGSFSQS
jgi:hypothetical protein